ncbi:hypothetical protein RFI_07820, partial [Reticulomyxa filosa]
MYELFFCVKPKRSLHNLSSDLMSPSKAPLEKNRSVTLKIKYKFQQLNIRLNKPHRQRHVAQFGLAETNLTFYLYGDYSYSLKANIGNFTALDLTNMGKEMSSIKMRSPMILGLTESSHNAWNITDNAMSGGPKVRSNKVLFKFSYDVSLFDTLTHRYETNVSASISPMVFVYHNLLVMEIFDYIQSGMLGLFTMSSKVKGANDDEIKQLLSPLNEGNYDNEVSFDHLDPLTPPPPPLHLVEEATTTNAMATNADQKPKRRRVRGHGGSNDKQKKSHSSILGSGSFGMLSADITDMDTAIKYSITIDKPIIAFPLNRTSEHTIDLNLGSISISNKVRMDGNKKKASERVHSISRPESNEDLIVVEDMCIKMEHVQLTSSQNRQTRIMEMSVNTTVTRGLSWTKILEPNFRINTTIAELKVRMSQQNCKSVLAMLWGNIWAPYEVHKVESISPRLEDMQSFQSTEAKKLCLLTKKSERETLEDAVDEINQVIQSKSKEQIQKYEHEIKQDQKKHRSHYEMLEREENVGCGWTKEQKTQLQRLKTLMSSYHPLPSTSISAPLKKEIQEEANTEKLMRNLLYHLRQLHKIKNKQYTITNGNIEPQIIVTVAEPHITINPQATLRSFDFDEAPPAHRAKTLPKDRFFELSVSKDLEAKKRAMDRTAASALSSSFLGDLMQSPRKEEVAVNAKPAMTAVKFAFDEEFTEFVSMSMDFQINKVVLKLQNNRSPFCEFGIDRFQTHFKREHSGDTDLRITTAAIRLNNINNSGPPQAFTKMLCPFEEIKQFLKRKGGKENEETVVGKTTLENTVPLLDYQQKYTIDGRTVTKIEIAEPCGFLLPSLLKDLQDFATAVTSDDTNVSSDENKILTPQEDHHGAAVVALPNSQNDLLLKIKEARIICLED